MRREAVAAYNISHRVIYLSQCVRKCKAASLNAQLFAIFADRNIRTISRRCAHGVKDIAEKQNLVWATTQTSRNADKALRDAFNLSGLGFQ